MPDDIKSSLTDKMVEAAYDSGTSFLYRKNPAPAHTSSVTQKAHHTPSAPANLLRSQAVGIMKTRFRSRDKNRDGNPFPRPSSTPEQVTETAETTNPRLMICRARA